MPGADITSHRQRSGLVATCLPELSHVLTQNTPPEQELRPTPSRDFGPTKSLRSSSPLPKTRENRFFESNRICSTENVP